MVISVITIILAIIINNIVYIKSSNEAINKIDIDIESTVPTGYVSKSNFTQGFLGGRVDYTVSKKVGDRVVALERKSEFYGLNKPLIGYGIQYSDVNNSKWDRISTWEDGYRKMLFFHPNINYKKYPNDLSSINNMSDDKVIEMLKKHKEEQDKQKEIVGKAWQQPDMVFTSCTGHWYDRSLLNTQFRRFIEKNGDYLNYDHNITLHGLRHTNASLLLVAGEDIENVSKHLGHSSSDITSRVYAHTLAETKVRIAKTIADTLS